MRTDGPDTRRTLVLIPVHNEADSLPAVIANVRACCPGLDILVVDDGSTDGSWRVLDRLDVRYARMPVRLGIGAAVRAGLRYACRHHYDIVVRIDGDGQHRAEDIPEVVAPLVAGAADVVCGSRYLSSSVSAVPRWRRLSQRALGLGLSALAGEPVTDPTSGFCAFGPHAVAVLSEHHPTGYPEPELRLLLSRSGFRVVERRIGARSRLAGRTTMTPERSLIAAARVLLALLLVPLRSSVVGGRHG